MPACAPASYSERVSTPCATCVRRSIARSSTASVTPSGVKRSVTRAASPRSKRISVSAPFASVHEREFVAGMDVAQRRCVVLRVQRALQIGRG